MKLYQLIIFLFLGTLNSVCLAQENSEWDGNSISQVEYDALRSLNTKIPVNDTGKLYYAIQKLTKKVEQDLFPDNSVHFKIDIDLYTDHLQGGHTFTLIAEDYQQDIRIGYACFMPVKVQETKDMLKNFIVNAGREDQGGYPITLCEYKGACDRKSNRALKYYDYNNIFNVSVESISNIWDVRQFANKVCTSFEKHGLHNLTEYLLSLPVYEEKQEVIEEPIQELFNEEPISVSIELTEPDHQFTLADEAFLNIKITNQSYEQLDNLEFEIEVLKDKVVAKENDFGSLGLIRIYKSKLFWEPAISLKTLKENSKNLGYQLIRSGSPFSLPSTYQMNYDIIIKSAPEDNAWICNNLILKKTEPLLSELIKVTIKNADGDILYDKQTPILSNGNNVKLTYPNFTDPAINILDREHLDYYLNGDVNFSDFNGGFIKMLACRAARYNQNDYLTSNNKWKQLDRHPPYLTIPEEEHKVIENIAQYVYDVFSYKNYPEPLWAPSIHADNIIKGQYGLGKPISSIWPSFAKGQFAVDYVGLMEKDKTGIACIEHAYFFNNLTRLFGFPSREINALIFPIPVWSDLNGGSQDASSEIFYYNPLSGIYEWNFFSLFNNTGKPIKEPFKRYGSTFGYFFLWRGVNSGSKYESGPKDNRFTMLTEKLNKSHLWEFYAVGYSSQMEYNVPFEDAWRPRPQIKLEAHSPLTMLVELPDGKIIGSKAKIEVSNDLRQSYVFNNLPEDMERQFSPFDGGVYLPEGLPIVKFTPPFIEETVQQIILPEQYITFIKDLPIQLFGTGLGEYTLKLSIIEKDITRTYEEIKGVIDQGQIIELNMGDFKEGPIIKNNAGTGLTSSFLNNIFFQKKDIILIISFTLLIIIFGIRFSKRDFKKQ